MNDDNLKALLDMAITCTKAFRLVHMQDAEKFEILWGKLGLDIIHCKWYPTYNEHGFTYENSSDMSHPPMIVITRDIDDKSRLRLIIGPQMRKRIKEKIISTLVLKDPKPCYNGMKKDPYSSTEYTLLENL